MKPYIFIGIDVAKHHHDAYILNHSTGEILCEHMRFDNTQNGFHSLIETVSELEPESLLFGMEATGHYHQSLAHFLSSLGYHVGLLNPLQTNRLRDVDLRRVKTDKIDAKVITKALILGYHQPFSVPSIDTTQLKTLSRFRFKLVEQRSRAKVSLVNCLDLLFPEYASFFKGTALHSKTSYAILKRYSSAHAIANARLDGLSNLILKYRKNLRSPLELKNLAKSSVGRHSDSIVTQMLMVIEQIEFFSKQIDEIEHIIEKEINFIDTPLMTIPGISFTLSSTILGEISSINRFKDSSKLLAFCGLNPTIHQSGQYVSNHNSMSKRGSRYLRHAILRAASLIWINDPCFNAYYHKKKRQGKHHNVILGHIAHKLIRVIFHLLSTNSSFISQPC